MKFLCDHMLARLGRWLRAAGYDTVIIEDELGDEEIFNKAVRENRLLLTRDKPFYERHRGSKVVWLNANSLQGCVIELSNQLQINWVLNPFSRCLICNEPFFVIEESSAENVPEDILNSGQQLKYCSKCNKTFWEGSHTSHMHHQLLIWANKNPI